MTYLYKLQNNIPLPLIPTGTSSPTQEEVTAYGKANGGKTLITSEKPGEYYTQSYLENTTTITEVWTALPIETVKASQIEKNNKNTEAAKSDMLKDFCPAELLLFKSKAPEAIAEIAKIRNLSIEKTTEIINKNIAKSDTVISTLSATSSKANTDIQNATSIEEVEIQNINVADIENETENRLVELGLNEKYPTAYSIANLVLDGTNYLDTGIELFKENHDFSLLMKFNIDRGALSETGQNTLLHCMLEAAPYPGITVQTNLAGGARSLNIDLNLNPSAILATNMIQDETVNDFSKTYYLLVSRKNDTGVSTYVLFDETGINILKTNSVTSEIPEGTFRDQTLLLGAADLASTVESTNIQRNITGNIYSFDYFTQVLTAENAIEFISEKL